MKPGKYLYCEVQGYSNSDKPFKFNPKGWVKPTNSLNEALGSASNQFGLNEYDTIEELMMGDFGVDIYKYDAYNWHTWSTHLGK